MAAHGTPCVLVVEDENDLREILRISLENASFDVTDAEDGVQAINQLQKKSFDVVLLDIQMPRVDGLEVLKYVKETSPDTEVIMLSGVDEISIAVECMQLGAFTYLSKPCDAKELASTILKAMDRRTLSRENRVLRSRIEGTGKDGSIVGASDTLGQVMSVAEKVAPTDSPVLIQGASGTGKELVARFIHDRSQRASGPFVTVNCSAIPETLIESELFGHMKGAFTDAKSTRSGLVDLAHGGTLFLDEIGEIALALQPKLLRFLQFGDFRRVGGNEPLHADVRIVTATNRDLLADVKSGSFREDLLYRINVITLELPPLRKRQEDIPLLVQHFLDRRSTQQIRYSIDPRALDLLQGYSWPGNVRELENVIERATILCEGGVVRPGNVVLSSKEKLPVSEGGTSPIGTAIPIKELEKQHIAGVLASVQWNKKTAAGILGISLKTLYTKIHQYQLAES